MDTAPKLLIFDVNETLLNLKPLKECVNAKLNSTLAFDLWFPELLQYAMVETLTDTYRDFGDIGAATLEMTAQQLSVSLSEQEIKDTLSIITQLQPHPDVMEGLDQLSAQGFRLVALTNGGQSSLEQQMQFSQLESYFDSLYSVEAVKCFKPHPKTYRYVLSKEEALPSEAMLIAAHAWDIIGAQREGLQTAFVQRPGKFLYSKSPRPSLVVKDLKELVKRLV
jgi:2-haloacid dehalogenase